MLAGLDAAPGNIYGRRRRSVGALLEIFRCQRNFFHITAAEEIKPGVKEHLTALGHIHTAVPGGILGAVARVGAGLCHDEVGAALQAGQGRLMDHHKRVADVTERQRDTRHDVGQALLADRAQVRHRRTGDGDARHGRVDIQPQVDGEEDTVDQLIDRVLRTDGLAAVKTLRPASLAWRIVAMRSSGRSSVSVPSRRRQTW